MRAKPYDWLKLKTDYVLGDVDSVASWFAQYHPEISQDTYEKKTKGWRDERRLYTAKAHDLALKKAVTKRADLLARQAAAGQLLQTVGLDALVDRATGKIKDGMLPADPDQATRMVKAGADMERDALLAAEMPGGPLAGDVGVGVGVEIGPDDIEKIRLFARAYGRHKALGGAP